MARRKRHQRGTVQEHGGQWTLLYREYNHARRKWTQKRQALGKLKNRSAALKAAEPIMARVNERNHSDKQPDRHAGITFKQFVETRWKAHTRNLQPTTLDGYRSAMKTTIMPKFGEMEMASIKPVDVSEFFEELPTKSAGTRKYLYAILHTIFELACDYDMIQQSPVRAKLHRQEAEKVAKPTLTVEEVRNVLTNLDEEPRLFVLLVVVTGMRINEARALRWTDFDQSTRELRIEHTLYKKTLKVPKTGGSKRTLRMHPAIAEMLSSHRKVSSFRDETDFIFAGITGEPIGSKHLRSQLAFALDAAGIKREKGKHGFHIFRHTAGSLLYARSRNMKLVQGALGHSNISTTSDIYVHLDDRAVAEGTEMLATEILGDFSSKSYPNVTQKSSNSRFRKKGIRCMVSGCQVITRNDNHLSPLRR